MRAAQFPGREEVNLESGDLGIDSEFGAYSLTRATEESRTRGGGGEVREIQRIRVSPIYEQMEREGTEALGPRGERVRKR